MSEGHKILIVDDEKDIVSLVEASLAADAYTIFKAHDGNGGLDLARKVLPDLILLDIMLPGIDGLSMCKRLKESPETAGISVIMLTAKHEEITMLKSFEYGALDYVQKPFSPKILAARVRAQLSRSGSKKTEAQLIEVHGIRIDHSTHSVHANGVEIDLSPTEFLILDLFAQNPGHVFSRSKIIDLIRGDEKIVTERSVDVQILGLRKKLGALEDVIETVRGVGYRMSKI